MILGVSEVLNNVRDRQTFSAKGQTENTVGSIGCLLSLQHLHNSFKMQKLYLLTAVEHRLLTPT